jgi:hypothetical protein
MSKQKYPIGFFGIIKKCFGATGLISTKAARLGSAIAMIQSTKEHTDSLIIFKDNFGWNLLRHNLCK